MKLQLPKLPKLTIKRPAFLTRKTGKQKPVMTLHAATASHRMKPSVDDYDEEEPQTRLSSAFFVVLILHVVAVGGIYAFNSIKEHRRGLEPNAARTATGKSAPQATAAPVKPQAAAAPVIAPKPADIAAAAPSPVVTTPVSNSKVYHVKQGDTLTRIAQQLGTTVVALQLSNKETATLRPGQILNVPAKSSSAAVAPVIEPPAPNPVAKKAEAAPASAKAAPAAKASTYKYKGDTATSIARRFSVSVDDLLKLNKVTDPKRLQLGQTLKLPTKKN